MYHLLSLNVVFLLDLLHDTYQYHIAVFYTYMFLPFPLVDYEVIGVSYWVSVLLSPWSIPSLFHRIHIAIPMISVCETLIPQHSFKKYLLSALCQELFKGEVINKINLST